MKTSLFLPLLLLAQYGCVQTVNLTTGDRQVVVECILSEAPQQTLLLSLTNGVSGIGPDALEGAVAALVDLTAGGLAGYFILGEDGVWVLDYAALPEHSYRLEIDVPGYGSVKAEDTMPPAVNVPYSLPRDSLFNVVQDIDSTYFFHRVHVPADESRGRPEWDTYVLTAAYYYQTASLPDHLLVEGFVYDAGSEVYNLCRTLCTDCPGVVGTNLNGTVYRSELFQNDYDCHKENPLLDGASNYIKYLKIDKTKASEQDYFTIWGAFNWDSHPSHRDYLLFSALSENYSSYIDSAASRLQGYSDLATLFSRDSSFTNIEGGVGVFGSKTTGVLPVQRAHVWWEQYQPLIPQS